MVRRSQSFSGLRGPSVPLIALLMVAGWPGIAAARSTAASPDACGAALIGAGASHVPAGAYGGAPDEQPTGYRGGAVIGHFPTRYKTRNARLPGTGGAFVVRSDQEWIGAAGDQAA